MSLSNDDKLKLRQAFNAIDKDGNGQLTEQEILKAFAHAGEPITPAELSSELAKIDTNQDGTLNFNEFCNAVVGHRKSAGSNFGKTVAAVGASVSVTYDSGGKHSFSVEERDSFADHMNNVLKGDKASDARLPIKLEGVDLFQRCKDGVLLAKLINYSVPDTLDERVLNTKVGMNVFQMTENNNVVVNSAQAIGCRVVNVGAPDIISGNETILLGLIWQIIRIGLLSQISLANHPELFRLLEDGEDIQDLLKLPPEQILLRWFNYHLKNAGHPRRVHNFSGDIADSECYTILLNQLDKQCTKEALNLKDPEQRAEKMLQQADKLGCRKFVKPSDVARGQPKLNLAFVANLFNTHPGLEPLSEEEKQNVEDMLFSGEGSREARAFCLWINSLGIDPFVHNLFDDLRDGLVILRVMDKVQPGIVDWKQVNQKLPLNKFKKVENCNYAVDLGKQMKFSLVGIGGTDLVDGNQTLTLALVWQLMRLHVLTILKEVAGKIGKKEVTEADMVNWANQKVKEGGKKSSMDGFKDSSLANSHFFLDLLSAIRDCVDYDLVTPGDNPEDAMMNAKYAISLARKIGCCIFLLPEDIVEVKPKMILTLVGTIMAVALQM
jgi:plastin-1